MTKPGERKCKQQKSCSILSQGHLLTTITIQKSVITLYYLPVGPFTEITTKLWTCVCIWTKPMSTCTVQGVIDWNISQVRAQVRKGCVLCFYLFILCSHRYNLFNDVGLIFRWLLRDTNTHKPNAFCRLVSKLDEHTLPFNPSMVESHP